VKIVSVEEGEQDYHVSMRKSTWYSSSVSKYWEY